MKQINRDKQIWKKNSERTHVEEPRPLREMQVLLMLSCTPAMEMKETVSWKGECNKWANGAVQVINAHIIKIWNWYSVTINRQLAYTNTNVLFLWNPFTCCLWFLLFTRLATWEAKHKNSGIRSQCVIHSYLCGKIDCPRKSHHLSLMKLYLILTRCIWDDFKK